MLRVKTALAIISLLLLTASQAHTCSWARGYFYQVTALKGQVVGTNIVLLQSARWLRQSFARKHAKLTLYEYRWPISALSDMPLIKTVEADTHGKFDFGPLKTGHYVLIVNEEKWGGSDWFDVEVKDLPRMTESVIIDVSPNFPDCTGGHELIVKSK